MKIVRNAMNYDYKEIVGEVNRLPSLTVPDLTMSVREIFDRYARGAELPRRESVWDEDESAELPNPATLDLVDRQEMQYAVKEIFSSINVKIKDDKETKDVSGEQSSQNDGSAEDE